MLRERPATGRGQDAAAQRGAALLEVLVAILITAFGLLALAGLQTRMNAAMMESYQRAQALTLLED
ncbi:MAG: type IV pilus modification protein PilV, partial [Ramlibacter sp.]|nr:type IV pilus modification protein PilV [Ramlibacter sp.]